MYVILYAAALLFLKKTEMSNVYFTTLKVQA